MTTEEFLSAEIVKTQAELDRAILNRSRWDALCDDRRMLLFLQRRAGTGDFRGVREELTLIAEGRTRILEIRGPRRKALDCLRDWTSALGQIQGPQPRLPEPAA
jgi:hypothetical protein